MKWCLFFICCLAQLTISCQNTPSKAPTAPPLASNEPLPSTTLQIDSTSSEQPPFQFSYSLNDPDKTLEMPGRLDEISGLSIAADDDELLAVQDEKGIIFTIDKKKGDVEAEDEFWKGGDFEGIELVKGIVYVVNSSGTIFEIRRLGKSDQKVVKHNTFLKRINDIEGLGFDPQSQQLLVACKGRPATGNSIEDFRLKKCIYRFDLQSKRLDSIPAYTIALKDVRAYLKKCKDSEKLEKLKAYFSPDKANLTFNPSAIAVHPINGHVYILSSVGKLLFVLAKNGKILHIEKLSKKKHPQPEGIAFDESGDLYISNEAKGGKAVIYRFEE